MHFNNIIGAAVGFSVVTFATPTNLIERDQCPTKMTAADMVANINQLTVMSQKLQPVVSNIDPGLIGIGIITGGSNPYQPLIDGFKGIINTAQGDISSMSTSGMSMYSNPGAQQVCDAFRQFVYVHQQLLNIVIGKSGILQSLFLGPVAAVLRTLEGVVDTLAFAIIASVPPCQSDANTNKNNLDITVNKAICAYTPGGTVGLDFVCRVFVQ